MGWASESTAFLCDPSLGSAMSKAAQAQRDCCRADQLWICMLRHLGAECGLVDDQQRINLTQLMQQRPQALPPWLLDSWQLRYLLSVEGDKVYLSPRDPSAASTRKVREARAAEQQRQLERLCGAGEELLASTATSCAANTGFLLLQPPLPTQLLAQADTASMLALAQVCRGLHCASFELLRREQACLHGTPLANGPAPPPYLPLQRLPPEQQEQGQQQGQQQQRLQRQVPVAQCRVNRALSLLCGSPEAARRLLQHRAGGGGGSGTEGSQPAAPAVDYMSTCGRKYEVDDLFSGAFKLIPRDLVTRIIFCRQEDPLDDPHHCELLGVRPKDLPKALRFMEAWREKMRPMREQQGSVGELDKAVGSLMEVTRSAARLGCGLCLLHTVW